MATRRVKRGRKGNENGEEETDETMNVEKLNRELTSSEPPHKMNKV